MVTSHDVNDDAKSRMFWCKISCVKFWFKFKFKLLVDYRTFPIKKFIFEKKFFKTYSKILLQNLSLK